MFKHIIIASALISSGLASGAEARSKYGPAYGLKIHDYKQAKIKSNATQERISNQRDAVDRQKTN